MMTMSELLACENTKRCVLKGASHSKSGGLTRGVK
jgi:hypothetical protein